MKFPVEVSIACSLPGNSTMSESMNQIILNMLDRMIDENVRTVEVLTTVRQAIIEQRNELGENHKILEVIQVAQKDSSIQSGIFVDELKDHISVEIDRINDIIKNEIIIRLETIEEKKDRVLHQKRFDSFLRKIHSKKFWVATVAGVIAGISTLVGGAVTLVKAWNTQPNAPVVTPQAAPSTGVHNPGNKGNE